MTSLHGLVSNQACNNVCKIRRILKCLSIGTPNTSTIPFVQNGKQCFLCVPVFKHIIIRLQYAQILGHQKIINFPFGTNGKFISFRCPNT